MFVSPMVHSQRVCVNNCRIFHPCGVPAKPKVLVQSVLQRQASKPDQQTQHEPLEVNQIPDRDLEDFLFVCYLRLNY